MQEINTTQTSVAPITTTPVANKQSKQSNFLVILLSILLLISILVAGFFAHQTQQLVKELQVMRIELEQKPVVTTESTIESVITESSEINPAVDWKTYTDPKLRYSIKYPSSWRIISGDFFGTGPKEIGEDVIWGVNTFDINAKSLADVIDDLGKQFPDRKQTINKIKVGNLSATQVITTTTSMSDWYYEVIIFEDADTIFTISNGAITDMNLQKMVGVSAGISFKNFYSSFKLLN